MKRSPHPAVDLLEQVVPFCFLSPAEKKQLVRDLREYAFKKGETIYSKGDSDDSIFLIKKGAVETVDHRASGVTRINVINAGRYFGERSAIFNQKRVYTVKAVSETLCYSISGRNFRRLIRSSKAFSKSMSTILRDKQGIFSAFERFKAEVLQGIAKERIDIKALIPYYRDMEPAMHKFLDSKGRIDTAALDYAVKRLPENLTRNFIYILIDELYDHIPEPWKLFDPVPAEARRRRCWKMLEGQTMMLYRPGISDLLDLITCLCVFTVEAEKIRERLSEHRLLLAIKNHLAKRESEAAELLGGGAPLSGEAGVLGFQPAASAAHKERGKADAAFLKTLPFSQEELDGLKAVWPDALVYLYDIAIHSGVFTLIIKKQIDIYNTRRAEMWLSQIGDSVKRLTGYRVNALPADMNVHIISSNTHSVLNCLNYNLIAKMDDILSWGVKTKHPALKQKWLNKYDRLYALSRDYLERADEKAASRLQNIEGVMLLERTASTGIQAQLFYLKKLGGRKADPGLPLVPKGSNALIVNIDYAFGEQAAEIMRNLLLQFGKNLASINIVGKAGALLGKRGDILLPNAFIGQSEDLFQPLENRALASLERLQKRLGKARIHKGPMLTVDGTLFQNSMMLSFYRRIWDCIGLEMEGVYYLKQIIEARQYALISNDVITNFYYYVSDLPDDPQSQLSTSLELSEGIPPLYAITREILTDIFLFEETAAGKGAAEKITGYEKTLNHR